MLDRILGAGMRPDMDRVVFTYGDTVYVPSGRELPDYLLVHESAHSRQQGADPGAWWMRYTTDRYFRLSQEVEAYAAQYDFMCGHVRDRNRRAGVLVEIANVLAGPTYGEMVSVMDALKMVKDKSKTK